MAGAAFVGLAFEAGIFGDSSDSGDDGSDNEEHIPRAPFLITEIAERVLFQRTRLDRTVFQYVLGVIAPILERNTKKGRYIHLTPMEKLYVTLQFYASGSFQWLVGASGRVSQSSASHAIREVTNALVSVSQRFVCFPAPEEYDGVKQAFHMMGVNRHGTGFPNVLGAIDCTHVRLKAPGQNKEQYFNRHLYHSLNVQLIVGPDLKIFNVFAEFPGSNHDAYIWRNSAVRNGFTEGDFPEGWLVGDSGYPQEPWLMTPVANIITPAEQLYNSVHITTRNVVERTNGVLKSRWHVLDSPLAYTPARVCAFTAACCVLHNICTEYNLDVDNIQEYPLPDDHPYQGAVDINGNHSRRDLIAQHFT